MLHRRTLLQALGLSAGSLVLNSFPLAIPRARAQAPYRRILFYVTSHGTVYDNWKIRQAGQDESTDFDIDLRTLAKDQFSSILEPLYDLKSQIMVVDGLANAVGRVRGFNEHEMGHASILTASLPSEVQGALARPAGPSLDQVIAAQLKEPGPFASLEYGIGGWDVNFDSNGHPVPLQRDVIEAHNRIFGGDTSSPQAPSDTTRIAQAQGSVLDLVGRQYAQLGAKLGAEDRRKLEQHRSLVRDLEQTLSNLKEISCEAPAAPSGQPAWNTAGWPRWHEDVYFKLSSLAFSCRLSRVITIRHDQIPNATVQAGPGDLHNDFAHHTHSNAQAKEIMTRYHTHQAHAFARLVQQLAQIPEGAGSLLDNTIVVWCNELANGHHQMTNIPLVIAGGGSTFRLGQYIRFAPTHTMQAPWSQPRIGPAHNQLLTSLGQAMGLSLSSFGEPQIPQAGGGQIPTTGSLKRISL